MPKLYFFSPCVVDRCGFSNAHSTFYFNMLLNLKTDLVSAALQPNKKKIMYSLDPLRNSRCFEMNMSGC